MKMKLTLVRTVFLLGLVTGAQMCCQSLPRCQTRDLSIRVPGGPGVAGGGKLAYNFELANQGNQTCTLSGYPAAVALDAKGKVVHSVRFEHALGVVAGPEDQRLRTIRLNAGGHAWFQVFGYDGMGEEDLKPCQIVTGIRITPPGGNPPFQKIDQFATCLDFTPTISFLLPGNPSE
jgi:hypothetical protein